MVFLFAFFIGCLLIFILLLFVRWLYWTSHETYRNWALFLGVISRWSGDVSWRDDSSRGSDLGTITLSGSKFQSSIQDYLSQGKVAIDALARRIESSQIRKDDERFYSLTEVTFQQKQKMQEAYRSWKNANFN